MSGRTFNLAAAHEQHAGELHTVALAHARKYHQELDEVVGATNLAFVQLCQHTAAVPVGTMPSIARDLIDQRRTEHSRHRLLPRINVKLQSVAQRQRFDLRRLLWEVAPDVRTCILLALYCDADHPRKTRRLVREYLAKHWTLPRIDRAFQAVKEVLT